jgi:hypothetical protein
MVKNRVSKEARFFCYFVQHTEHLPFLTLQWLHDEQSLQAGHFSA